MCFDWPAKARAGKLTEPGVTARLWNLPGQDSFLEALPSLQKSLGDL